MTRAKTAIENQALQAGESQAVVDKPAIEMVRGLIPMNRAIAGIGKAGDVVRLPKTEAQSYEAEGYLEILED